MGVRNERIRLRMGARVRIAVGGTWKASSDGRSGIHR
jgi:hypothetical protein